MIHKLSNYFLEDLLDDFLDVFLDPFLEAFLDPFRERLLAPPSSFEDNFLDDNLPSSPTFLLNLATGLYLITLPSS